MPQPRRSASTAADTRRRLLAAVHILAKEAGLSRDIYEAAIDGVHPGVASAADLTNKELHEMCRRFSSKKAAQAKPKPKPKPKRSRPLVRKVFGLWFQLGREGIIREPSRSALRKFVARQTQISDPEWLSDAQASQVIEALKQLKKRQEK